MKKNGYKNIKNIFFKWIERYLFFPNFLDRLISIVLFPLTIIYCIVNLTKKFFLSEKFDIGIPVISIGNLIIGGSGKTPMTIAFAKSIKNSAVVLRGYNRKSSGLIIVNNKNKIQCDVQTSGDEAMLISKLLRNSIVIVSENRKKGIIKAKELGAEVVFLDDGFSKFDIKKFDILIRPKIEPTNLFCLPSGGYREPKFLYNYANLVLKDDLDFKRVVTFTKDGLRLPSLPKKHVCVTAISKPDRLREFFRENTPIISFYDHYEFKLEDIEEIKNKYIDYSIVTTLKDFVKLEKFNLDNIILMELELKFNEQCNVDTVKEYIYNYNK